MVHQILFHHFQILSPFWHNSHWSSLSLSFSLILSALNIHCLGSFLHTQWNFPGLLLLPCCHLNGSSSLLLLWWLHWRSQALPHYYLPRLSNWLLPSSNPLMPMLKQAFVTPAPVAPHRSVSKAVAAPIKRRSFRQFLNPLNMHIYEPIRINTASKFSRRPLTEPFSKHHFITVSELRRGTFCNSSLKKWLSGSSSTINALYAQVAYTRLGYSPSLWISSKILVLICSLKSE